MTDPPVSKCIGCNEAEGELEAMTVVMTERLGRNPHHGRVVVHPHHAPQARAFLEFTARYAKTFVAVMLTGTVVAIVLAVLITTVLADNERSEDYWAGVLFGPYAMLIGLFVIRFPFSTPETVKWLGLAKSRLLAQVVGWTGVGIGAWILLTRLF